ncbi:MAG: 2-oxoglutarate dehydrogenase E2 component (dihydrolipoamide succinyltransferase) [Flavobacteriales bacterium]|jgi:2-oxoglutarate dehydrogenase E2 component (dihydrolipoamide succinyltransferase)
MSVLEMKVPSPGESISEVEIATWLVQDGDWVERDQTIAEVDSDKATLELPAEDAGIITLKAEEGDTVAVGDVICLIDTAAKRPKSAAAPKAKVEEVVAEAKPAVVAAKPEAVAATNKDVSPVARKMMADHGMSAAGVNGSGANGRITKKDVLSALSAGIDGSSILGWGGTRDQHNEKMSSLRRKIAQRLVSVKNETAMLTTFNEVNMQPIMDVRAKYKQIFKEKYGVGLGFMSFFTKAVTEALHLYPSVNAAMDGNEMKFHDYADIGIAVSSPKGLMVPVVRNAENLSLAEIEAEIKRLALKARDGKITIDEMTGGTFTITNGGIFGSMLSTPIINPPQSAILGMHNIIERPVAENGQVVIRPIMYVALSYDHRIIDGKESVSFLVKVKDMLENPEKMLFGAKDPMEVLLGL